MNRKITKSEFSEVMKFCKKKGVDFLDLRLEVADHLAESVELLWVKEPKLTLETALKTTFKEFGIYGFTDVIEEHNKRMMAKYGQVFYNELKKSLSLTFIALVTMGSILLYQILMKLPAFTVWLEWLVYAYIVILPTIVTFQYFKNRNIIKGEQLMLLNSPYQFTYFFNCFLFMGGIKIMDFQGVLVAGMALKITISLMVVTLFYMITFRLQKKARTEVLEFKTKIRELA